MAVPAEPTHRFVVVAMPDGEPVLEPAAGT